MRETIYVDPLLIDLPEDDMECETADDCTKTWFLLKNSRLSAHASATEIADMPFTVGRKPGNSLQIVEPTVSGHHARILELEDDLLLEDLGSTNGTFVNGNRVKGICRLVDGDTVFFGQASYQLTDRQPSSISPEETSFENVADEVRIHHLFEQAMHQEALSPVYQPIVDLNSRKTIGYEALCRSQILGLESASDIFRAAESRGEEENISHQLRMAAVEIFQPATATSSLYLNTHPKEFESADFINNLIELRQRSSRLPIFLEIHEHAVTSKDSMRRLCDQLKELRIGLAFDDFGCGESRLLELIRYKPDVVKFDRSLIEGLHQSDRGQKVVETLVSLLQDFDVVALAEGIESEVDAQACREVGFELAQGYFFGRPKPFKNIR